jgi:uncharacterized DUF497 family protein
MKFEWDLSKESENILKPSVTFLESTSSFSDPVGIQLEDSNHSATEARFFWIGRSSKGRVLTTRFAFRDGGIRIIGSAEWRKFRRIYLEAAKNK